MRGQSASYGSWAQGGPKPACLWGLFVNKVLLVHSPSIPWHGAYGCFRTIPAEFSSCSRDSKSHTNWAIWEARKSHKALDIHYLASYRKKKVSTSALDERLQTFMAVSQNVNYLFGEIRGDFGFFSFCASFKNESTSLAIRKKNRQCVFTTK